MHIDVDAASFEHAVIEGSRKTPVVVDFWAPWCAPCRTLTPILEKLAAEYDGAFVLAKVNADDNGELAARYGVRGIPSVKAFVNGTIVDEFTGALPGEAVREFLRRVVPSRSDALRLDALKLYADTHDVDRALEPLAEAERLDPENDEVRIDRAALLVSAGRYAEARALIERLLPLVQMDERVSALRAKIDLAEAAEHAPSEQALRQRLTTNPSDLDARLQLAYVHLEGGGYRDALEQLLEIVRSDLKYRDNIARKTMLQVFELLGNEGELVREFRRKLASVMN